MRSFNFILTSLCLIILSCKKDKASKVSESPETSCVCLKENIGVALGNNVPCYGFLTMTTYSDMTGNSPLSYVSTNAFFTNIAAYQESGNGMVSVDSVYLNEQSVKSVKDANGNHMYYQNNYSSWPSQQNWIVFGANGIPTFTFSADVKNPVADFSQLPDKINKNLVRTFKLNGVANITGGYATIADQSGKTYWNVSIIVREGTNYLCFPQEQIKLLGPGKASLTISLENTNVQTFNSKNIAFSKRLQYTKNIELEP
jgi:hypothetical protein